MTVYAGDHVQRSDVPVAEYGRIAIKRRRCAAPVRRSPRRAQPWRGPPGAPAPSLPDAAPDPAGVRHAMRYEAVSRLPRPIDCPAPGDRIKATPRDEAPIVLWGGGAVRGGWLSCVSVDGDVHDEPRSGCIRLRRVGGDVADGEAVARRDAQRGAG
jgi:hypothetical protein